jgi:hypothetical protein
MGLHFGAGAWWLRWGSVVVPWCSAINYTLERRPCNERNGLSRGDGFTDPGALASHWLCADPGTFTVRVTLATVHVRAA